MAEMLPQPRKRRAVWRVFWYVFLSFMALLSGLLLFFTLSSLTLTVAHYSLEADVVSPIRIVHLSDLHNSQFGKNNETLIELVASQHPDLIVMSGDMLNRNEEETRIVCTLISDLSEIAPVYYGYGNHEKAWEQRFGQSLQPIFESAGAVVVDNDFVDLEVHGTQVRIGGYMGYYPIPHMTTNDKAQQEREFEFFHDFQNTESLKLLIDHIPTSWVDWHYVDKCPVDIVFSGHYHGGVIRIPILDQGLYAPYVGWFPPFSKGVFAGSQATCVLSAGLGNEQCIPRINNSPEIVVVDLIPNHA